MVKQKKGVIKMTYTNFYNEIITPLSKAFDVKIYYNGEAPDGFNYNFTDFVGLTYGYRKDKVITITRLKHELCQLQVLCHELTHILLHSRGTKFKGDVEIAEFEAELSAKCVFEALNLKYDPNYLDYLRKNYKRRKKPNTKSIIEASNKIIEELNKLNLKGVCGSHGIRISK